VRLPFHHYLLAGCGFFLFFPALTFLCGVLDLPLAASVVLAAVTALLIVFIGRVAGWQRTWWQTLLLSITFLGLLSLGTMSRWRGLLFTTGGLLLVGAFMQLIAQQWSQRPQKNKKETASTPQEGPAIESEPTEPPAEELLQADSLTTESSSPSRYCPHCGACLNETFAFCPACGHDANVFCRCPACGSEHYVPPEAELSHCPACGNPLNGLS